MSFLRYKCHCSYRCPPVSQRSILTMGSTIRETARRNEVDLLRVALAGLHGEYCQDDINEALVLAASNGNYECVEILLAAEADVNSVDLDGDSALMLACSKDYMKIVDLLLSYGCDVNLSSHCGQTAFHMASYHQHQDIVERLLTIGNIDVNLQNRYGDTPLMLAITSGQAEIVKLLIHADADVNLRNLDKDSSLHFAAKNGFLEIVEMLLECGAEIDAQNLWGYTPVLQAAMENHREVVQKLIENNCDIHKACQADKTPLHYASNRGHVECVKILLAAGADPNTCDFHGSTPLMEAAVYARIPVIKLLLHAGGDATIMSSTVLAGRWTSALPFWAALPHGNLELTKVLFLAGGISHPELQSVVKTGLWNWTENNVLRDWLMQVASKPLHLTQMCRLVIRQAMPKPVAKWTHCLPIPKTIQEYLNYMDIQ